MRNISFLLFFLFSTTGFSQSITGTNGLFKVPSAYVYPDGTAYLGASFYPKGYYNLYGTSNEFDGMPTFFTLSLFDRLEFMFRYTHQLGQKVSEETRYFPDRMFSIRYNIVKEGMNIPAITVGFHDISEALGGSTAQPWFLASYIVFSKVKQIDNLSLSVSLGYAHNIFNTNSLLPPVFLGLFGGLELSDSRIPNFSLVTEIDSGQPNIAFKTTVIKHLHFSLGLLNFRVPSGFFTYRFNLL